MIPILNSGSLSLRALACLTALVAASVASAQTHFHVQLDTSSLIGNSSAPFYLDFQLNDGDGTGNANNTVFINHFNFGTGAALPSANLFGGASGDLATGVTITDTTPFNEFYQPFTAGLLLNFDVSLTNTVELGGIPDIFTFAILDKDLFNVATESFGTDAFIEVNIDSPAPVAATFASADGSISAPMITPVPEPSTYGAFAVAALGLLVWQKRRRK